MLSMVKCSVLLVARWANQVVQDRRWSGWSAAGLCGGNPQYLVSPLLLFCISWWLDRNAEAGVQAAIAALFLSFGELFMLRAVSYYYYY